MNDTKLELSSKFKKVKEFRRVHEYSFQYIATAPKLVSYGLSDLIVDRLEYRLEQIEEFKKRKNRTIKYLIYAYIVLLILFYLFYLIPALDRDTFLYVAAFFVTIIFGCCILLCVYILYEAAKNGAKFLIDYYGYKLTEFKPYDGDYVTSANYYRYLDYKKDENTYLYWQLLKERSLWDTMGNRDYWVSIHGIMNEVAGFDEYHGMVGANVNDSNHSEIIGKNNKKLFINFALDDTEISSYYVQDIKKQADAKNCSNILIFTPYDHIAEKARKTIENTKVRGAKIVTPEYFISKLN